jgi:hypothetical protein
LLVSAHPSLPVRDESLDFVSVIEAPAASDQDWFRKECARALRPDGAVLMTIYNALSYKGLMTRLADRLRRRERPAWAGLYYQMSLREQLRRWKTAGFEPARALGFYWSPLPRNSDSRWVVPCAVFERLLGLRKLVGLSPWVLVELRKCGAPGQT